MMLARFEQPDGGFSILADNLQLGATLGQCSTLLLAALPAGLAGQFLLAGLLLDGWHAACCCMLACETVYLEAACCWVPI